MTRENVYRAAMAAACALLAELLAASALGVLRDGAARRAGDPMAEIYTRGIAAEKLAALAPLFFLAAGLLAAGLLLGVRARERPAREPELLRDLLAARVARPSPAMRAERAAQRRLLYAGWGAFAACMLPVAAFLLDPAHFPLDDLEGMFRGLLRALLPWTALGIAALAAAGTLREKRVLREIDAIRARLEEERAEGLDAGPAPVPRQREPAALRAVLAAAAVALIVAGACNGSARDVLYKAITICTECVGLG